MRDQVCINEKVFFQIQLSYHLLILSLENGDIIQKSNEKFEIIQYAKLRNMELVTGLGLSSQTITQNVSTIKFYSSVCVSAQFCR